MRSVTEKAAGKLNLTLDVLGVRPDGYHEMRMLMQTVALFDTVTVSLPETGGWCCTCDVSGVPENGENLALRAAEVFYAAYGGRPAHLSVHIQKQIPMQGGMAGGSADAAAVLRGLNTLHGSPYPVEHLCQLAQQVGSDVPYCVLGGTALAEGRGERLTPLDPMPPAWFVLVKPEFSVSTPRLFGELDRNGIDIHPNTERSLSCLARGDLEGLCACMQNVFQPVLSREYPVIDVLCASLRDMGALAACLTGTGSVVFGVFREEGAALTARDRLQAEGFTAYAVKNV